MIKKIIYNPWPLGKLKKKYVRPEILILKKRGYKFNDPREIVDIFEKKVALYAGSKYAVSVDCCSHGIFLVLKYLNLKKTITIPKRTYVSVPMQILHAGYKVKFKDISWTGAYQLAPLPVWDFATRWKRNMFNGEFNVCSFQLKKRIPIGRGGMILTNSLNAYKKLKLMRYDGRDLEKNYMKNKYKFLGWHYYMTPEDAARGMILFDDIKHNQEDTGGHNNYSDLSKYKIFK